MANEQEKQAGQPQVVGLGEENLKRLTARAEVAEVEMPVKRAILKDRVLSNMAPLIDGFEALHELAQDPEIKQKKSNEIPAIYNRADALLGRLEKLSTVYKNLG